VGNVSAVFVRKEIGSVGPLYAAFAYQLVLIRNFLKGLEKSITQETISWVYHGASFVVFKALSPTFTPSIFSFYWYTELFVMITRVKKNMEKIGKPTRSKSHICSFRASSKLEYPLALEEP